MPLRIASHAKVPVAVLVAVLLAAASVVSTAPPVLAGQVRQREWWLGALHITRAWRDSAGAGVTVALLDTGAYPAAPDLRGQVTAGPDYTQSGRDDGGIYWGLHGTAMTSLIAGHGHGPKGLPVRGCRPGAAGQGCARQRRDAGAGIRSRCHPGRDIRRRTTGPRALWQVATCENADDQEVAR